MADERKSALLTIRSDALRAVLNLRDAVPVLGELLRDIIQLVVVLDATAVQQQLRWRLGSRRNPTARTRMHELIDSGVVVAVAPTFLKQEIEKYLPAIATDAGVSIEIARMEWEHVQHMIRFHEPTGDGAEFVSVDPKDSPYALTARELDADCVHTTDPHFSQMGVTVIGPEMDEVLRDYARSTSIVVNLKVGSCFVLTFGLEILVEFVRAVEKMIRKLPPTVKLILGIGLTIALLHPDSREKLIQPFTKTWERVKEMEPAFVASSQRAIAALGEAARNSSTTRDVIKSRVRVAGKQTALSHARRVCLRSQEPLSVDEIARRILANGYQSRSKTFSAYVRRLLRENPAFTASVDGLWTVGVAG